MTVGRPVSYLNGSPDIPIELVAASGSGLDPHISPSAARWQVPRVALARGVSAARITAALAEAIAGRDFGFLGEPTVNVLDPNLALDKQFGQPLAASPHSVSVVR